VITAEAVLAARDDAQPTGEAYCELTMTGAVLASVPPLWRREVASFLRGILTRAPVATAPAYEEHRAILGALVLDLERWAVRDRDEQPEPATTDLRDPAIVARERQAIHGFREWAASEHVARAEAYRAHIDELVADVDASHVEAMTVLEAAAAAPALLPEVPDDPDWLR
jgi:hypothetical protein